MMALWARYPYVVQKDGREMCNGGIRTFCTLQLPQRTQRGGRDWVIGNGGHWDMVMAASPCWQDERGGKSPRPRLSLSIPDCIFPLSGHNGYSSVPGSPSPRLFLPEQSREGWTGNHLYACLGAYVMCDVCTVVWVSLAFQVLAPGRAGVSRERGGGLVDDWGMPRNCWHREPNNPGLRLDLVKVFDKRSSPG
ncbi:hypothetical protein LZ30DRAFT_710362 [Colletotrichum cereale]|nr:hypothetical protein LZ30DRAFT_710362 [Colletotrichum cereale]